MADVSEQGSEIQAEGADNQRTTGHGIIIDKERIPPKLTYKVI